MTTVTGTPDSLQGVRFFEGLPDTLIWHLARAATTTRFAADQLLFGEGDARQFFAVITSGNVAIEHGASHTRLAILGPGEVIGEGVLLEETHHGTSGRALQPTTAIVFMKEALEPLLKQNPALYAALVARAAKAIASRLKGADATLTGRGR
jgi:CRP-like cAMP-binding protein